MENEVKPYSLARLIEELKSKGLVVAEDMAEVLVMSLFDWVEKSAVASENKYDDLLLAAMPLIKAQVLSKVDKIDGEVTGEAV